MQANLSKSSLTNLIKQIELYGKQLDSGVQLGVEEATKLLYDTIINKMQQYNLSEHIVEVKTTYDKEKKLGKVYTNDIVLIFHEFGTGIKGTQDDWANTFNYQVNQSGKGEKGWKFYNQKHGYGGITHGLTTKHIFYESLLEVQRQVSKSISLSISKTTGAMY